MVVPGAFERRELQLAQSCEVAAAYLGAQRSSGRNHVDRSAADIACNFALDAQNHRNPQLHEPIRKCYPRAVGGESKPTAQLCKRKYRFRTWSFRYTILPQTGVDLVPRGRAPTQRLLVD